MSALTRTAALVRWTVVLGALGVPTRSAVAQGARPAGCEEALVQGRAALERGRAAPAARSLSAAVDLDPACGSREGGLAGEWLGRSHAARGDTAAALQTWERTLGALDEDRWRLGGDRIVGAYLETLLRAGKARAPEASDAFNLLMRPSTGSVLGEEYGRLLAQLASVLPDSLRMVAFPGGDWRRGVADPSGPLAEWWVEQDPYPATRPNERVQEHLDRVAYALRAYPDLTSQTGYDGRGALYVRFGAPTVARTLAFDDARFVMDLSRLSAGITRQSFPDNEVWVYEKIDPTMTYVFIRQGGAYRLGQSVDLLPPQLRDVGASGGRQGERAAAALLAMRYVYDQLATTALEYGRAWAQVEDLFNGTASPVHHPRSAARDIQRSTTLLEAERERERAEREPPSQSLVYSEAPALPFSAQRARYLTAEGATRLDLWWRADLSAEPVQGVLRGDAALVGSVVMDPRTFRRETVVANLQQIRWEQVRGRAPVPVQEASVGCGRSACEVAVQIDLFDQSMASSGLGPRVRSAVWRPEPSEPLRAEGLELSDLKPIDAAFDEPIPDGAVPPGTPLSIYFEAYGLHSDPGPARFTVEYETVLRRRGSILRRTVEEARAGVLRSVVRGSRTEQYLLLRTADWAGSDQVDVTIRVRDERTGAEVERALRLGVRTE